MYFVALLILASAISASFIETTGKGISIPLKHVLNVTNVKNIVNNGKARIDRVNGISSLMARAGSGPITNEDVHYVTPIVIGGKTWQLIVDTGSSNTWCGASGACEKTATGVDTGGTVQVSYGSGSFSGTEYTDMVSFGGLTVTKQSIGAATSATGFQGVDGVVGFGPVGLTAGTVSNVKTVPTFTNNLFSQGLITSEAISVYLRPKTGSNSDSENGEVGCFTGSPSFPNPVYYNGTLHWHPTVKSGAAAAYWGISIASINYGSTSLGSATGIVDTGTTLIYIPTAAYNKFLSAAGGLTDSNSGLAAFTKKPTSNFSITFGSTAYTLTPTQYLVPTAQYSVFGLPSGKFYAWINDGGSSGVNTIIGQKFLEIYFSVFDTTNSRIGFATAV